MTRARELGAQQPLDVSPNSRFGGCGGCLCATELYIYIYSWLGSACVLRTSANWAKRYVVKLIGEWGKRSPREIVMEICRLYKLAWLEL